MPLINQDHFGILNMRLIVQENTEKKWFDFKEQECCKWIETQIKELNDINDFKKRQND